MSDTIKVLNGNRILLNTPKKKERAVTLLAETQEHLTKDEMKEWTHLEIFALGDKVDPKFQVGQKVLVPTDQLGQAYPVEINGEAKMMIPEFIIALIWEN